MTINITTPSDRGGAPEHRPQSFPQTAPPAEVASVLDQLSDLGLPSECELTRWANELFGPVPDGALGALPVGGGGAPTPSVRIPEGLGGTHAAATSSATPAAPPHAASPYSTSLPASTFGTPPHVGSTAGSGLTDDAKLRALVAPRVLTDAVPGNPGAFSTSGPSFYFLEGLGSNAPSVPGMPSLREMSPQLPRSVPMGPRVFDVHSIRRDFPILDEIVDGRRLVWLDNAATTHKPNAVIDRIAYFYQHENSNIHRAAHTLAARSTDAFEAARDKVAKFLGAGSNREIVFTRGATEAINLIAQSWGRQNIGQGDEIVLTHLEHHANIVPWQQLASEKGARILVAPVDDSGQLLLDEFQKLLGAKTRLVSFPQVSNALGTLTPAPQIVEMAHRHGARVLVDGAQAVSHMPVDVQALDADWYVFSGHKLFAPTGIGALYGKPDLLETMPPWQGGGNMIQDVTFEKTVYQAAPMRFEAGTGSIADAVGLGAAIDYVESLGMANIARYEHELLEHLTRTLSGIPGLRVVGTAAEKAGVVSFVLNGFDTEKVGKALARDGIAVRAGHHCAQPILRRFGLEATVRPSLAFYNTHEEIDQLGVAVRRIQSGRTAV